MPKPKIPEYFDIIEVSKDKLLFKSSERSIYLKGESLSLVKTLLPYLKGEFEPKEISNKSKISEEEVREILKLLSEKELIVYNANSDLSIEKINFFMRKRGIKKLSELEALKKAKITLIGVGEIGLNTLKSLINYNIGEIVVIDKNLNKQNEKFKDLKNIKWYKKEIDEKDIKDSDIVLFCSDKPDFKTPHLINELCVKNDTPWISARFDGLTGEVGPLVVPRKTACYNCYDKRIKSNLENIDEQLVFEKHLEKNEPANYGSLNQFYTIIAEYLSLEVIKYITKYEHPVTLGAVLFIDFDNYENKLYKVLKIPRCPVCSMR